MNSIDRTFARLKASGRKAFMPFITAGDPNLGTTATLIENLGLHGADLVEIGFPFSDPIADGPVIQASYTRALDAGLKIDSLLETIKKSSATASVPPLVGMISYSIIYRKDPGVFLKQCRESGLSGLIVPDLPVEEMEALAKIASKLDLKLILLVTPTTSDDRVKMIAKVSGGFLYCVSLVGITGERAELPPSVRDYLKRLRTLTDLPLCVGFGVSRPDQVEMLRDHVDGVIVGSALVRKLESGLESVFELSGQLAKSLNPS